MMRRYGYTFGRKMRTLLLVCAFGLLSDAVYAEAASPDTAVLDAKTLEEAKTYMKAVHYDVAFRAFAEAGSNKYYELFAKANPGHEDAIRKIVDDNFKSANDQVTGEMFTRLAEIYARHCTYDELKAMVGFFQTPTGKSVADKYPLIIADYSQMAANVTMNAFTQPLRNLYTEVRAQGLNVPQPSHPQDQSK